MSEFNIGRLRTAVQWAEAEYAKKELGDDSLWDQSLWALGGPTKRLRVPKRVDGEDPDGSVFVEVKCGSAYCVAGWVCANEGDKFVAFDWQVLSSGEDIHAEYVIPKGSREAFSVGDRARDLLGIEEWEADELFEGFNTIHDVRETAQRIAARRGETL